MKIFDFFFLSRRSEYFFSFDDKFEIHDDIEILKRMGLLLGKSISMISLFV